MSAGHGAVTQEVQLLQDRADFCAELHHVAFDSRSADACFADLRVWITFGFCMSGLKNEVQNGVWTPFWTSFFNSISAAGEPIPAVMKPFLKPYETLYEGL